MGNQKERRLLKEIKQLNKEILKVIETQRKFFYKLKVVQIQGLIVASKLKLVLEEKK